MPITKNDQSFITSTINIETNQEPPTKRFKESITAIWVLFNLETTGFSRVNDEIIEIAAMILGPNGKAVDNGSFSSLVKPKSPIPSTITQLTGIKQSHVQNS